MYVFLGGSPGAGKSLLTEEFIYTQGLINKLEIAHIDIDAFRDEWRGDPNLSSWVNIFWNKDEKTYWENVSYEEHIKNLVDQSEKLWPEIVKKINSYILKYQHVIFEGVNLLPHLVKDLDMKGFFLVMGDEEELLKRLKDEPRWGQTEELQKLEAKYFIQYDGRFIKEQAKKYDLRVVSSTAKGYKILEGLFS